MRNADGSRDEKKAEARMIARRIRELTESGLVYDRTEGAYRRVQYRDIVILDPEHKRVGGKLFLRSGGGRNSGLLGEQGRVF